MSKYSYSHLKNHVHTRRLKKKYHVTPESRRSYPTIVIDDNTVAVWPDLNEIVRKLAHMENLLRLLIP